MENTLILTKDSSLEMIKRYFESILKLSQSQEDFPVNFDSVWMLVFTNRSHAVRSLKRNFMEGVDYQVLTSKGQNLNGGRPMDEYHLTTSCLEFFIARKVRAVFEVYRKVFHTVANNPRQFPVPTTFREALLLAAHQQEIIEEQTAQIEEKNSRLNIARTIYKEERPLVNYSKGVLAEDTLVEVHALGKMLSNIKELNMGPKKIWNWLREHKYIKYGSAEPYQEFISKKRWFVYKENQVKNIFGLGTHMESKTYLTPKGRIAIVNQMYKEKGIEAPNELELRFE